MEDRMADRKCPALWEDRANNLEQHSAPYSKADQERQDAEAPIAHTRIVLGRKAASIYVPYCPLCGLEHTHGLFSYPDGDPLQAYENDGHRPAPCEAKAMGWVVCCIGDEWRIISRPPPPEYRGPQGYSYRLVLGPERACFTPRGIKNKHALAAMAKLARGGVPWSFQILKPRTRFILDRVD